MFSHMTNHTYDLFRFSTLDWNKITQDASFVFEEQYPKSS